MASPSAEYQAALKRLEEAAQRRSQYNKLMLDRVMAEEERRRAELEAAKKPSLKKVLSGTLAGAGTGAATGTMISPGYGTAIGAVVGGLAGGALGYFDDSGAPVSSQQVLGNLGQAGMTAGMAYQASQDKSANRDLTKQLAEINAGKAAPAAQVSQSQLVQPLMASPDISRGVDAYQPSTAPQAPSEQLGALQLQDPAAQALKLYQENPYTFDLANYQNKGKIG